jgi:hypothetical protein
LALLLNRFTIARRGELVFQLHLLGFKFELRIAVKEELIFRVAEQLYRRKLYPKAAEFYRRLLASPIRRYREQALQRLYEIANYWLQDSWNVVKHGADFKEPDWLVYVYPHDVVSGILPAPRDVFQQALFCRNLLHWDDSKPFFNEEAQAIELLRIIHDREPTGRFADKALYLMGYVAWFNENWCRADECFSCLEENHPESAFYPFALELAIKSKLMRDDLAKDRRRFEEVRRLIDTALKHPRLSEEKKDGVLNLLFSVHLALARLDFEDAEKCQLAGRLDEARSRYQKLCEDYPGTYDAERAKERLNRLKGK